MTDVLQFAKAADFIALLPRRANRHGLIAGATGGGLMGVLVKRAVRAMLGSLLGSSRRRR